MSDEEWEGLKKIRKESGLTWNLFIREFRERYEEDRIFHSRLD